VSPARDRKKGADSGLDGYIYFIDDNSGAAKKVVVQVKSPSADGPERPSPDGWA